MFQAQSTKHKLRLAQHTQYFNLTLHFPGELLYFAKIWKGNSSYGEGPCPQTLPYKTPCLPADQHRVIYGKTTFRWNWLPRKMMISSLLWSLIKTLQGKLFLVGQNSRSLLTFYVKYIQVYTGIIFESRYIHIQIQCLREESAIYLLPTEYNSYQQS